VLTLTAKHIDKLKDISTAVTTTLSNLIRGSGDVSIALEQLESFAPLGTIPAYIDLLRSSTDSTAKVIDVNAGTVDRLLALGKAGNKEEVYTLITALLEISPSATKAFGRALESDPKLLEVTGLLGAVKLLLGLPGGINGKESVTTIVDTAIQALVTKTISFDTLDSSLGIVTTIGRSEPLLLLQAVQKLKYEDFNPHLAKAAVTIGQIGSPDALPVLKYLTEIGLQWAVRALSSDGILHQSTFESLSHLRKSAFCAKTFYTY